MPQMTLADIFSMFMSSESIWLAQKGGVLLTPRPLSVDAIINHYPEYLEHNVRSMFVSTISTPCLSIILED